MSSRLQDQNYLSSQYRTAKNLSTRRELNVRFSTNRYDWFRWLFDQFDPPANANILEIGAGPGWLWKNNGVRICNGWQIILSDMSGGMVEEQRQNLKEIPHPFQFGVIDAQAIPLKDSTFDMITANHVLHHVHDISKALSEIRRVLRLDGKFCAATNGHAHMHEINDLIDGFTQEGNTYIEPFPFSLENGSELIAPFFSEVSLRRYTDALEVTEIEPLIAYISSGMRYRSAVIEQKPEAFHTYLETELSKTGTIHITKDVGLFVASMPRK